MSAYFTIGYTGDACESADALMRNAFQGYMVQVTLAGGEQFDAILLGPAEWDGQQGQPLRVRRCDAEGVFTSEEEVVDATGILVY